MFVAHGGPSVPLIEPLDASALLSQAFGTVNDPKNSIDSRPSKYSAIPGGVLARAVVRGSNLRPRWALGSS
jgi:hypothetical protein